MGWIETRKTAIHWPVFYPNLKYVQLVFYLNPNTSDSYLTRLSELTGLLLIVPYIFNKKCLQLLTTLYIDLYRLTSSYIFSHIQITSTYIFYILIFYIFFYNIQLIIYFFSYFLEIRIFLHTANMKSIYIYIFYKHNIL